VASAACALLALALGQDANYDQQNYHFYAPYALLNNRICTTFSRPSRTHFCQSHPLSAVPLARVERPPILIGALLGACMASPMRALSAGKDGAAPASTAIRPGGDVLAALGLTGAVAIAESGTTFIDNLMSALV